jgi:hypothetical protein
MSIDPSALLPSEPATDRVTYAADDLLTSDAGLAPLVANGVRCHGGFDADGHYRSPRTRHRGPAIEAWQAQVVRGGTPLLELAPELLPPQYPNVAQSKVLLKAGVREPVVRALTTIAIVEGFGAVIRDVKVPALRSLLVEPIEGTALAHLDHGLFEAHARDEAGHRDEGGHKQMWEAARDLAFESPRIPGDVLMRLMGRRGGGPARTRAYPELDETLEAMLSAMVNVFVVEIFAARTFDWGEQLLSDPEVSAEPQRAGDMVRFIRSDERPHVEYLRAALSEVRARTLRGADGATLSGREVVDRLMHRTLRTLTTSRQRDQRTDTRAALLEEITKLGARSGLIEEFDALESPWTPPARTGFERATAGGEASATPAGDGVAA